MSTEPKRYSPDIPMDWDLHFRESATGSILRADDPAIVSALKDSEDLQTIQHLVGAHSVDEIKQWKRSHEGMKKLEKLIPRELPNKLLAKSVDGLTVFLHVDERLFTGLSLIEAIEQVKE